MPLRPIRWTPLCRELALNYILLAKIVLEKIGALVSYSYILYSKLCRTDKIAS